VTIPFFVSPLMTSSQPQSHTARSGSKGWKLQGKEQPGGNSLLIVKSDKLFAHGYMDPNTHDYGLSSTKDYMGCLHPMNYCYLLHIFGALDALSFSYRGKTALEI
jgi:hypothetical protein